MWEQSTLLAVACRPGLTGSYEIGKTRRPFTTGAPLANKRPKSGDDGSQQLGFGLEVPLVRPPATPARRPGERDLQANPQTRMKLQALTSYLPAWMRIAASKNGPDAFVMDLMAGPGIYRDGDTAQAYGSPVIACNAALRVTDWMAKRGREWRCHLRFVEPDSDTRASLQAQLARFEGLLDFIVLPARAEDVTAQLSRESRGHPTFALLDPNGIVPISFDLISRFRGRPFTELLLSFDAQILMRSPAAGQSKAITEFSGGAWWRDFTDAKGQLDLESYMPQLCRELNQVFPYVALQRLEFPAAHANRAMIQLCMSVGGREEWLAAMHRARPEDATVIMEFAADLKRRGSIDDVIERLARLAGRTVTYKSILQQLFDVAVGEREIHQALLFMRSVGVVGWTSWLSRHAVPRPRFSFAPEPSALRWDGEERPPDRPTAVRAIAR